MTKRVTRTSNQSKASNSTTSDEKDKTVEDKTNKRVATLRNRTNNVDSEENTKTEPGTSRSTRSSNKEVNKSVLDSASSSDTKENATEVSNGRKNLRSKQEEKKIENQITSRSQAALLNEEAHSSNTEINQAVLDSTSPSESKENLTEVCNGRRKLRSRSRTALVNEEAHSSNTEINQPVLDSASPSESKENVTEESNGRRKLRSKQEEKKIENQMASRSQTVVVNERPRKTRSSRISGHMSLRSLSATKNSESKKAKKQPMSRRGNPRNVKKRKYDSKSQSTGQSSSQSDDENNTEEEAEDTKEMASDVSNPDVVELPAETSQQGKSKVLLNKSPIGESESKLANSEKASSSETEKNTNNITPDSEIEEPCAKKSKLISEHEENIIESSNTSQHTLSNSLTEAENNTKQESDSKLSENSVEKDKVELDTDSELRQSVNPEDEASNSEITTETPCTAIVNDDNSEREKSPTEEEKPSINCETPKALNPGKCSITSKQLLQSLIKNSDKHLNNETGKPSRSLNSNFETANEAQNTSLMEAESDCKPKSSGELQADTEAEGTTTEANTDDINNEELITENFTPKKSSSPILVEETSDHSSSTNSSFEGKPAGTSRSDLSSPSRSSAADLSFSPKQSNSTTETSTSDTETSESSTEAESSETPTGIKSSPTLKENAKIDTSGRSTSDIPVEIEADEKTGQAKIDTSLETDTSSETSVDAEVAKITAAEISPKQKMQLKVSIPLSRISKSNLSLILKSENPRDSTNEVGQNSESLSTDTTASTSSDAKEDTPVEPIPSDVHEKEQTQDTETESKMQNSNSPRRSIENCAGSTTENEIIKTNNESVQTSCTSRTFFTEPSVSPIPVCRDDTQPDRSTISETDHSSMYDASAESEAGPSVSKIHTPKMPILATSTPEDSTASARTPRTPNHDSLIASTESSISVSLSTEIQADNLRIANGHNDVQANSENVEQMSGRNQEPSDEDSLNANCDELRAVNQLTESLNELHEMSSGCRDRNDSGMCSSVEQTTPSTLFSVAEVIKNQENTLSLAILNTISNILAVTEAPSSDEDENKENEYNGTKHANIENENNENENNENERNENENEEKGDDKRGSETVTQPPEEVVNLADDLYLSSSAAGSNSLATSGNEFNDIDDDSYIQSNSDPGIPNSETDGSL